FTLGFNGQSTIALPFNAAAATVQAALESLSTVGSGNVVVTAATNGYYVAFQNALGGAAENLVALKAGRVAGVSGVAPAVCRLAGGGAVQDNPNTNAPTYTLVVGPTSSASFTTGANRFGVGNVTLSNYGAFTTATAATLSGVIAPLSQSGGGTTRTITVTDTPADIDLVISANIVDGVGNVLA